MLALCKFCLDDRKMIEVTVSTYFRAEALACSTQRGLSHVTGYFFGNRWLDLVCLGVLNKVVGNEGEEHSGLWSQNYESE
jgi:hypothetical protein